MLLTQWILPWLVVIWTSRYTDNPSFGWIDDFLMELHHKWIDRLDTVFTAIPVR